MRYQIADFGADAGGGAGVTIAIVAFVFAVFVLIVSILLILAIFRIRNAAEKCAAEAAEQTDRLTAQVEHLAALNKQMHWLNEYISRRK